VRRVLLEVLCTAVVVHCIDVDIDDDYASGWMGPDTSVAQKFRKFAQQYVATIQVAETDGEGESANFDVELLGKLRAVVGGNPGLTGPRGKPGMLGAKGQPGDRGPRGDQGGNGRLGKDGPKSRIDGPQGPRGIQGPDGQLGPQGRQGKRGPKGVPGREGPTGDEGPIGSKSGPPGKRGPKGDRGKPGGMGTVGLTGGRGRPGKPGPPGPIGDAGAAGSRPPPGKPGDMGPVGSEGTTGDPGEQGAIGQKGLVGKAGPQGPVGIEGLAGERGLPGDPGPKGSKGKPGPRGPPGVYGKAGHRGDKGPEGAPGLVGKQGATGQNGHPGPVGPDGEPGRQGPKGPTGKPGPVGSTGRVGKAGSAGPIGAKGRQFKYSITGPAKFAVGLGGDRGLIYSSQNGMFFEHTENPCQIRFVQKISQQGKSTQPGIVAAYRGNIGIGTRVPQRKLHVEDRCTKKQDAECSNRKGQIMLSASWRNTLMSKMKTTNYDMIGSYVNWAKGRSAVHIAAYDSQAKPMTTPTARVFFGAVPDGAVQPRVRVENMNGKFYATKFVKKIKKTYTEDLYRNADVLLDTGSVDLVDISLALHAKTAHHEEKLRRLESETKTLLAQVKMLRQKGQ